MTDSEILTLIMWAAALALLFVFAILGERYASQASTRRPQAVAYLLEPHRENHSHTQEMRYLLEPYRGAVPAWEVIER